MCRRGLLGTHYHMASSLAQEEIVGITIFLVQRMELRPVMASKIPTVGKSGHQEFCSKWSDAQGQVQPVSVRWLPEIPSSQAVFSKLQHWDWVVYTHIKHWSFVTGRAHRSDPELSPQDVHVQGPKCTELLFCAWS